MKRNQMNENLKIPSDGSEMRELRGAFMDAKCAKCGGIPLGAEESGIPGQCRCSVDSSRCFSCRFWEPRQNSGMGDGYCAIFDKFTDPDHGQRCTGFLHNS